MNGFADGHATSQAADSDAGDAGAGKLSAFDADWRGGDEGSESVPLPDMQFQSLEARIHTDSGGSAVAASPVNHSTAGGGGDFHSDLGAECPAADDVPDGAPRTPAREVERQRMRLGSPERSAANSRASPDRNPLRTAPAASQHCESVTLPLLTALQL